MGRVPQRSHTLLEIEYVAQPREAPEGSVEISPGWTLCEVKGKPWVKARKFICRPIGPARNISARLFSVHPRQLPSKPQTHPKPALSAMDSRSLRRFPLLILLKNQIGAYQRFALCTVNYGATRPERSKLPAPANRCGVFVRRLSTSRACLFPSRSIQLPLQDCLRNCTVANPP